MRQYRVFGRTAYPEPLAFRGTLTASDHDAAAGAARERFGSDWVELVLVPQDEIHWILRPAEAADA